MAQALVPIFASVIGSGLVSQIAIGVALSVGSALLQESQKPKAPTAAGAQLKISPDPNHPGVAIFGRTMVAGSIVHAADDMLVNRDVVKVLAIADAPVTGLVGIEVDEEEYAFTEPDADGFRTVTKPNGQSAFGGALKFIFYDGTQTVSDPWLTTNDPTWTASDIGTGVAYAILYISNYTAKNFPKGEPRVGWIVDGIKVWDWRDDAQIFSDPSTWKLSKNPAVLLVNYYLGIHSNGQFLLGLRRAISEIEMNVATDSANICDESVTDKDGNIVKRYEASGLMQTNLPNRKHVNQLMEAMAGKRSPINGLTHFYAGAAQPIVMEITQDDLLADMPVTVPRGKTLQQTFNTVTARYTDPAAHYKHSQIIKRTDTALVTSDGGEHVLDAVFEYVQNGRQAQVIAEMLRRENLYDTRVELSLGSIGETLGAGQWVKVTLPNKGIEDRYFAISKHKSLQNAVGVELKLSEVHPSIYSFTALDETDAGVRINQPSYKRPTFKATNWVIGTAAVESDQQTKIALKGYWSNFNDPRVTGLEIEYRPVGATSFQTTTVLNSEIGHIGHVWSDGIFGNVTYEARARPIINSDGDVRWSNWSTAPNATNPEVINGSTIAEGSITVTQLSSQALQSLRAEAALDSVAQTSRFALEQAQRVAEDVAGLAIEQFNDNERRDQWIDRVSQNVSSADGRLSASIQETKALLATSESTLATQINQVSTTVDSQSVTIQEHTQSIDGISGQYGVTINDNGQITGAVLLSGEGGVSNLSLVATQIGLHHPDDATGNIVPAITAELQDGQTQVVINGDAIVRSLDSQTVQALRIQSPPNADGNRALILDATENPFFEMNF